MVHSAGSSRYYFGLLALAAFTGIAALTLLFRKSITSYFHEATSLDGRVSNTKKMGQKELKKLTIENLALAKQGFYLNAKNEQINLKSGAIVAKDTRSYVIKQCNPLSPNNSFPKITVVETDCINAAKMYVDKKYQVAVLNFGGSTKAGGGIRDGIMAQEEYIYYTSPELNGFMQWVEENPNSFYPLKDPSSSTDRYLIHTPNIAICRGGLKEGFPLLDEPFYVGIITDVAPIKPKLNISEKGVKYADKADEEYMRQCIITQLNVAYEQRYNCVILGAFGCGVFQNPPQEVARIYHKVITDHFQGAFREIVFAITPDSYNGQHNPTGNLQPFQDYFEKKPI